MIAHGVTGSKGIAQADKALKAERTGALHRLRRLRRDATLQAEPMSPVVTPEEIAEKYAAQRKTLEDLLAEGLAELREMADRRKALVCDVTTGTGGDTELAALERTMATKTTAVDRIRESLPELDRREAIALAAASRAARRRCARISTSSSPSWRKPAQPSPTWSKLSGRPWSPPS